MNKDDTNRGDDDDDESYKTPMKKKRRNGVPGAPVKEIKYRVFDFSNLKPPSFKL